MKFILFCNLPYSFAILKPLEIEIIGRGFEYIWYLPDSIKDIFPYKESSYTSSIKELKNYETDAIYVAGNDVPHYLRGIKVQIFHGLAGEKRGHFRIRDYFDLYLTQGPYFTKRFQELADRYKNFEVMQTGWCKLDNLYDIQKNSLEMKKELLKKYGAKKIILYSPTFSPSLRSGVELFDTIKELSEDKNILVIVKFHDKMDREIQDSYKKIDSKNLILSDNKDITPLLQIADLMISDTSSVVYEFILLNKPVVTLNSISENINWSNFTNPKELKKEVLTILDGDDNFREKRKKVIELYHPYNDGKSAMRMVDAVVKYKKKFGVPKSRKLSLLRKFKIFQKYGI
ncbi:MAG: CDP-glycerol glycerophosphotransferase family protein [Campylobacterota bacterium]|nr:CDP-glycerol glycerophosphotransferase family protein [Campylobacterota bacterium]